MDMGDPEGARSILDEVLQEGNATQRQEAERLIAEPALRAWRMARIALGLEYDGTAFSGWQPQPHARSVQGELQRALARSPRIQSRLTAAGRTDAGVHALAQVAHFETSVERPMQRLGLGANTECCGRRERVLGAAVPRTTFMRATARSRARYRLPILNRPRAARARPRPRLLVRRVRSMRQRMHAAAQVLVGAHDFSSFRAAECQSRSTVRRLARDRRSSASGVYVDVTVRANAFLHHMVRNIAGTLLPSARASATQTGCGKCWPR